MSRLVTLDADTRVGQMAICAILAEIDMLSTEPAKELTKACYNAIRGLDVDRCVVASDGATCKVIYSFGTPALEAEKDGTGFYDLQRDPPAAGVWIYEGRVHNWYDDYSTEWDSSFDGKYRPLNDEDRELYILDDRLIAEEAREHDIEIEIPVSAP